MKLSSGLYRAARYTRTVEAVSKGRGVRRARNIAVGRGLAKAGVFGWLWGGRRKR